MNDLAKAVTTPLASIFGSGFLVIVPILAGSVGPYSVYAMIGICILAFSVGNVIRHNIRKAEPVLSGYAGRATRSFEWVSDLALVVAYVISVCLYIHILTSFVLGGLGIDTVFNEDVLTTIVIVGITGVGWVKGLDALEFLEQWALLITLVIVALLIACFAHYDFTHWKQTGMFALPELPASSLWQILTVLGGTLIVVQGFETPRYLAGSYDADTRVRASFWAQIISSCVYIAFVALALPLAAALNGTYDDNSLLTMAGIAFVFLPIPLVIAATLSQFSAAVADTIAATGNMEEVSSDRMTPRIGYLIVGAGAIVLTWSADTFQIVALASRAFAFYYLLQCIVAITVSENRLRQAGFACIAIILGFITLFAVPLA